MDSHGNSPSVSGPLSGMFSASALKAMSVEEAQDIAERTTAAAASAAAAIAAETSTAAAAATATVEAASIDAMLGAEGLPVQQNVRICMCQCVYSEACWKGKRLITVPDIIRDADELRQAIQSHGSGHVLVTYTPETRYTEILPRKEHVPNGTSSTTTSLFWTPPKHKRTSLWTSWAQPKRLSGMTLDKNERQDRCQQSADGNYWRQGRGNSHLL